MGLWQQQLGSSAWKCTPGPKRLAMQQLQWLAVAGVVAVCAENCSGIAARAGPFQQVTVLLLCFRRLIIVLLPEQCSV